jgi:hypothetical protein
MPQGPQTHHERRKREDQIRSQAQERENVAMSEAADAHLSAAGAAIRMAARSLENVRVDRRTDEGQALKRKLRALEEASGALRRVARFSDANRSAGTNYNDPDLAFVDPDLSIRGPGVNG